MLVRLNSRVELAAVRLLLAVVFGVARQDINTTTTRRGIHTRFILIFQLFYFLFRIFNKLLEPVFEFPLPRLK